MTLLRIKSWNRIDIPEEEWIDDFVENEIVAPDRCPESQEEIYIDDFVES